MDAADHNDSPASIRRTPKGKRPQYFADPATDKLLTMVMTLAEELSVTRDRLDTVERLLAAGNIVSAEAIENFEADAEAAEQREQRRADFIARLLRALRAELEEATARDFPHSRDDIMAQLD